MEEKKRFERPPLTFATRRFCMIQRVAAIKSPA
jgi:hypothetical protein